MRWVGRLWSDKRHQLATSSLSSPISWSAVSAASWSAEAHFYPINVLPL